VIWYPLVLLYPLKKLAGLKKMACALIAGVILLVSGINLALPLPGSQDSAQIARENDLAPLLDLMARQKGHLWLCGLLAGLQSFLFE
jgi:hypothetical protein